ncbi:hypothetical protein HYPSUDRAFT_197106 [Hypholoma sublateritium FD-334 SS-4]|uniref:Uncharacterized protein n=1 Tax=Hypholoma sublateritium (strain FD-334 SS-4) TaxID=945553 RepID=A0A0D2PKT9_HYPSF|nr:hypothetical protein HYPSUDRAFT_197106 [Hypholoma sublateritium FD-334 SS-4]
MRPAGRPGLQHAWNMEAQPTAFPPAPARILTRWPASHGAAPSFGPACLVPPARCPRAPVRPRTGDMNTARRQSGVAKRADHRTFLSVRTLEPPAAAVRVTSSANTRNKHTPAPPLPSPLPVQPANRQPPPRASASGRALPPPRGRPKSPPAPACPTSPIYHASRLPLPRVPWIDQQRWDPCGGSYSQRARRRARGALRMVPHAVRASAFVVRMQRKPTAGGKRYAAHHDPEKTPARQIPARGVDDGRAVGTNANAENQPSRIGRPVEALSGVLARTGASRAAVPGRSINPNAPPRARRQLRAVGRPNILQLVIKVCAVIPLYRPAHGGSPRTHEPTRVSPAVRSGEREARTPPTTPASRSMSLAAQCAMRTARTSGDTSAPAQPRGTATPTHPEFPANGSHSTSNCLARPLLAARHMTPAWDGGAGRVFLALVRGGGGRRTPRSRIGVRACVRARLAARCITGHHPRQRMERASPFTGRTAPAMRISVAVAATHSPTCLASRPQLSSRHNPRRSGPRAVSPRARIRA